MKMTGKLEMQFAVERNEIINNHPYITVVADVVGQRSHMAKIVPMIHFPELELLLVTARRKFFIGIRNKFCTVCHMAEREGLEAKNHKCFKNFDRNVSSARMESDAEGFTRSIAMHGVIFRTLIADGDSNMSVHQK